MNKIDTTPIQIFRNHLHLRNLIGLNGEVLAYTKIDDKYSGIIILNNGSKLPIRIESTGEIKVGLKVKIHPCVQGVNQKNLKEYGIIAKTND